MDGTWKSVSNKSKRTSINCYFYLQSKTQNKQVINKSIEIWTNKNDLTLPSLSLDNNNNWTLLYEMRSIALVLISELILLKFFSSVSGEQFLIETKDDHDRETTIRWVKVWFILYTIILCFVNLRSLWVYLSSLVVLTEFLSVY